MKLAKTIAGLAILSAVSGCTSVQQFFNPFYEPPTAQALLGDRNDHALNPSKGGGKSAREALEAMGTYERASLPQPNNPVMRPAIVRLMWVPDHLNKNGDLVPAHYYYLKVLSDRWAVSDAFELESQLNVGGGDASMIPYVTEEQ